MKDYNQLIDQHLKRIQKKYNSIFESEFENLINPYKEKWLVVKMHESLEDSPEVTSILRSVFMGSSLRDALTPFMTPDIFEI